MLKTKIFSSLELAGKRKGLSLFLPVTREKQGERP